MPAQFYLARVPDAISICSKDDSLNKLREIEQEFPTGNVAGDPWTHVDVFGRADFFKTLCQRHKALTQKSKSPSSSHSASGSTSPVTCSRRRKSPEKGNRKVAFECAEPMKEDSNLYGAGQSSSKS